MFKYLSVLFVLATCILATAEGSFWELLSPMATVSMALPLQTPDGPGMLSGDTSSIDILNGI